LNGLLNGEPYYTDQSSIRFFISIADPTTSMDVDGSSGNTGAATIAGSATKGKGKNTSMSVATSKFQMDWKNEEQNEVYTIAYEFHRVAPQILTTIVGTIVHGLRSTANIQRYGVTQFFGQLFASSNGQYASDYSSCFRDWLHRKNDIVPSIRLCVVQHCMSILRVTTSSSSSAEIGEAILSPIKSVRSSNNPSDDGGNQLNRYYDVALAVTETLSSIISTDPSLDVRTEAIHLVCDYLYQRPKVRISQSSSNTITHSKLNGLLLQLLHAISTRISSKQKQERRDAITGLAHIYVQPNVQPVLLACSRVTDNEEADDIDEDVAISSIAALREMCGSMNGSGLTVHHRIRAGGRRRRSSIEEDDDEESESDRDADFTDSTSTSVSDLYRWIPGKVMQCICFTDSTDAEMRSRVVQIIDEFLLKVSNDKKEQNNKNNGIAIAQAIGWASLLDSLVADSNGDSNGTLDLLTSNNYHRFVSTEFKFLLQLLTQRATLQNTINRYIDARAQTRQHDIGKDPLCI
jgi:hypothetical protein